VTLDDIALANRLAHEVLGRSLDELAPQTRRLLSDLDTLVAATATAEDLSRADVRFTRRQVREHCGWSDFQVRTHLDRLVGLEYVLTHRGGRGQSFVYGLLWDGGGVDGRPYLVDVDNLTVEPAVTTGDFEPLHGDFEGPSSPQLAPIEPGSRAAPNGQRPAATRQENGRGAGNTHLGNGSRSHVTAAGVGGED
jgi:hypothetical protein